MTGHVSHDQFLFRMHPGVITFSFLIFPFSFLLFALLMPCASIILYFFHDFTRAWACLFRYDIYDTYEAQMTTR